MCGRFTNDFSLPDIISAFDIGDIQGEFKTSYNIAPSQNVPVIYMRDTIRVLDTFRWGLIPSWSKDPAIGYKMINARAETIFEKPSFKQAVINRRCLMIANGFFEWKETPQGKVPYFIHVTDRKLFTFAAIWDTWKQENMEPIKSCSIITCEANEFMKPMHHRMPVILTKEAETLWLDASLKESAKLANLLQQYPADQMKAYMVSHLINKPGNNNPNLLLPKGE